MEETKEFRSSYFRLTLDPTDSQIRTPILYYRGSSENPQWMDVNEGNDFTTSRAFSDARPDMYSTLCFVQADDSQISKIFRQAYSLTGAVHYRLSYDIILSFGLTEFKAQICWMEDVC